MANFNSVAWCCFGEAVRLLACLKTLGSIGSIMPPRYQCCCAIPALTRRRALCCWKKVSLYIESAVWLTLDCWSVSDMRPSRAVYFGVPSMELVVWQGCFETRLPAASPMSAVQLLSDCVSLARAVYRCVMHGRHFCPIVLCSTVTE